MTHLDQQKLMSALKAKMPNARVQVGGFSALSADEKQLARENLHALNSQYKHVPVLGGGALYGVKK